LLRVVGRKLRNFDFVLPGLVENAALRFVKPPNGAKIALPLIAIVGPPRVGSTLMYQLLVTHYHLFYFDNLQHAFLRYPYLAFKVAKRLNSHTPATFFSDHGFVSGMGGLSEANFFWPFWFDMAMAQKEPAPVTSRLDHIGQVLNQIYLETKRPLVNSYNAHAFYLDELARRFEKLVVVNMRRDPVANAMSLLRARRLLVKSPQDWWSIRPGACSTSADPYEQIACQVVETYRQVKAQRRLVPDVPVVDVHYEDLCRTPAQFFEHFAAVCCQTAIPLTPRGSSQPTPELTASAPREEEAADVTRFQELFTSVDWDDLWNTP
jgi:hypothetical protein